ncbi:MAG: hypothetical protein R3B54_04755 [Bdellovibrionota bacterium]
MAIDRNAVIVSGKKAIAKALFNFHSSGMAVVRVLDHLGAHPVSGADLFEVARDWEVSIGGIKRQVSPIALYLAQHDTLPPFHHLVYKGRDSAGSLFIAKADAILIHEAARLFSVDVSVWVRGVVGNDEGKAARVFLNGA